MTDEEWLASDDPIAMLAELRARWRGEESDLERLVRTYLLQCCRAIWPLLPLEESRRGVDVAERFLIGRATREEFHRAEWAAEGAAFYFEERSAWAVDGQAPLFEEEWQRRYWQDKEVRIEALVRDVEAIPVPELRRLVRPPADGGPDSPRRLLLDAAYFVDAVMVAVNNGSWEDRLIDRHRQFLSTVVLHRMIGDPSRRLGPNSKPTWKPRHRFG